MIICGYAGVGKSTLAKGYVGIMDVGSTPL